jgi:hypothetical protein
MFCTTESQFAYDKSQTNYLFKTSFSGLVAGLYALYNKKYEFSLMAHLCWLSSINYWRNPTPGWRRNMDIIVVATSLINQYAKAYKYQYANIYYPLITLSASCYPISIYYYYNNKIWHSVYFHSCIHIFANIANIILYHGKRMTE